jgi:acyl-homoserine-lactone acylase
MEIADAVMPDLLQAAQGSADPLVKEAAAVLTKWDRMTNAESRGAVLFKLFADQYFGTGNIEPRLRVKFDPAHPLDSANGLADRARALQALAAAAQECRKTYGALEVPWGDVYRYASGKADVPGNGGPGRLGVFRTIDFTSRVGNRYYAAHGETFLCTIEFSKQQQAQCVLSYGNSSQPGSVHLEDQLPLMVQKKLHPVWRERKEIEANR